MARLATRPRAFMSAIMTATLACALSGCVGNTDPATSVTSKTAQLNAHGRTNDGPAEWWWEYSTSKSTLEANGGTRVCGNPPEADGRCGPAQAQQDVNLSVKVTGLTPGTTYWFRACGQDTNDAQKSCGSSLSFTTLIEHYVLDRKWGGFGSGDGQFRSPLGISTDSSNNVYVADYDNHRIQKFSATGAFLAKWGSLGSGDGQFNNPAGVAVDNPGLVGVPTTVYVTDRENSRVQQFSSTGGFVRKWGSRGVGDGQFSSPLGIAVQREEVNGVPLPRVYVADVDLDRIQKFDCCGSLLFKWGPNIGTDVAFDRPRGVAVRGDRAYAADYGNDRIQLVIGEGVAYGVLTEVPAPRAVGVDASGALYVPTDAGEIRKYRGDGSFVTKWGANGSGDGRFSFPGGIAFDSSGNVYVADTGNNRIQKFRKE